jgi:alkylation response protein AidB-like acyl-CoA dehydrogenase
MPLIEFSKEQKLILSEIRKFSQTELEPLAMDIDRNDVFPVDIVKKLTGLGLSGIIIPEEYGGAALDTTSFCIVLEELARASASVSTVLFVNNCLAAYPLVMCAGKEKKDRYLQQLCKGSVAGYCVDAGIDAQRARIQTRTMEQGCSISGEHDFVLNGETAQFLIMPMSLSDGHMHIVDVQAGMKTAKQGLMGLRGAGIVRIAFSDIVLNDATALADAAQPIDVWQAVHDYANIGFSAISLGVAVSARDASVTYAKERQQFGRPICEFPMVQEMLADMSAGIDAARCLVYDAAARVDRGEDFARAAHTARLVSSNTAVFCGTKAVQIYGGYGYTKDYPVERYLRDAKTIQLIMDTPYNLKLAIAEELLK